MLFPTHFQTLISNVQEVERLQEIHAKITNKGPGRKTDVEIIHKSCIVLLVACWESFVEDLAAEALEFLIENSPDHTTIPSDVLERVCSKYQGKRAWDLAGTGWKKALKNHFSEVLSKTTGTLNTPKTAQVNELFAKVLGLNDLSKQWYWPGRSVAQNENALDDLVTLRGSIAHRVKASQPVQKRHVTESIHFIGRLSVKCHNQIARHLAALTGAGTWEIYSYKKTQ